MRLTIRQLRNIIRESIMSTNNPVDKIVEYILHVHDSGGRAFSVWQSISRIDRNVAQEVHPKARAVDGTPLFKLWNKGRIEEYIEDIRGRLESNVDPETLQLVANEVSRIN